jgi:tetratricopeptide (TPR) repeat protein
MGAGEYGLRAPSDIMPKAKLAALRALAIDETLAEAHASLATVKFRFERDWAGAETEFKRAIDLNHGYAVAHYWYGIYLIVLSRFDEALKEIKIAQQLDPHSPAIHHSLGFLLYLSCQHEEAMEQLRRTIAMDATFPLAHITLGLTLLRKGIFEEAIAEIRRAFTIAGVVPLWQGFLGQAYALAGKSDDALNVLHELVDLSKQRYVPPVAVAIVYAGLGKIDDAFQWLDKSLEERDGLLVYLKVGSVFDCLRSDRRFSELLSRIGLQDNLGLPDQYLSEERPEKGARDQATREVEEGHAPEIKENQEDKKLTRTPMAVVPEQTARSTAVNQQSTRLRPTAFLITLAVGLIIAAVALSVAHYARKTLLPHRRMLAILPFKNLSGELEGQRLGEGLREELFTRLSEFHADILGVIELPSVDSGLSGEQACKRVMADYILGGSVRQAGDQVAITDQLLSCKIQTSIVGGRYEANLKDPVISTQLLLAEDIVKQVLTMLPKDVHSEHQVSREAYEAYLTGRYLWNRRTTQSLTDAITYFNKAIQYDKTYAPSYAGLADCYSLLGSAPYTALSPTDAFPKAEVNARKAIELDASLAEAHVSLGYSELVYDRDYQAAEQEFRRALQLRPSYATAHQFYAYYLTAKERLDEAIAERKQAEQLEPTSPLLNAALGEAYYQARQFDLAIEQNRKSLVLDPSYGVALINLGRAYEQKGLYSQALEAFQKVLAAAPNDPVLLAFLGHHYAISGRKNEARGIIARLQQLSTNRYVPSLYIALVYTGLREKDEAFKWLDKAYEERCEYLVYLRSEPLADPLRNDPRFPSFLGRLGLRK